MSWNRHITIHETSPSGDFFSELHFRIIAFFYAFFRFAAPFREHSENAPKNFASYVVVVVSHIQRIGCQPEKTTLHGGQSRSCELIKKRVN